MKLVLGAALVILVALLGSRKTFTKIRIPLAARHLYLTGTEFILVGWCLGSQLIGILDENSVRDLAPLLHLSLGWIGLMSGCQLDISMMKRFPGPFFRCTAIQAATTAFSCFIAAAIYFVFAKDLALQDSSLFAIAVAAIAIPTGQSSIILVINELKLRRRRIADMLSYVAGTDLLFGVVLLGFVFCFTRAGSISTTPLLAAPIYLAVSIGMGIVMGLMLHLLTRLRCTQEELLLFTIGIVVFSAGAAVYVGISPLFVTATGGFFIANTKSAKERILRALTTLEKPFYIIVLIVGGAQLDFLTHWQAGLLLAGIFVASRTAGKVLGGFTFAKAYSGSIQVPPSLGLGLVSQGGISAAMALSYYEAFETDMAGVIMIAAFSGIVLNELLSPSLVKPLVQKDN